MAKIKDFEEKIGSEGSLVKTGNWKKIKENKAIGNKDTAADIQKWMKSKVGRNHVGVAIEVENYSGYKLGDPQLHDRCGWKVNIYLLIPQSVAHSLTNLIISLT